MSRFGPDDDYPDRPGEPSRPPADPWAHRRDPWTDLTVPEPGHQERLPGAHRRSRHPDHPRQPGPPPPADHPTWGQQPPPAPPPAWGDQPTWAGQPTWGEAPTRPAAPVRGQPGREPGPVRRDPPRRRRGPLAALVVVLVLLVAAGVAATLYWVGDGAQPAADPTGSPGDEASATATAGGDEDDDAPPDRIGMGPAVAQPGDCLINEGTAEEPAMRVVPCDTDEDTLVYRVLSRFDEQVTGDTPQEQDQSAQQICAGTEGYAHHYRLVAENPQDSFVLCMEEA